MCVCACVCVCFCDMPPAVIMWCFLFISLSVRKSSVKEFWTLKSPPTMLVLIGSAKTYTDTNIGVWTETHPVGFQSMLLSGYLTSIYMSNSSAFQAHFQYLLFLLQGLRLSFLYTKFSHLNTDQLCCYVCSRVSCRYCTLIYSWKHKSVSILIYYTSIWLY